MIFYIVVALLAGCAGYLIHDPLFAKYKFLEEPVLRAFLFVAVALLASFCGWLLARKYVRKFLFSIAAIILGKLLSLLLFAFLPPFSTKEIVRIFVDLFLISAALFYFYKVDVDGTLFSNLLSRQAANKIRDNSNPEYKILDTSVIIDGRVADICEAGFLNGVLLIPQFVLLELQQIADSSDAIKRSRGRRGLDILNKMKLSDKCSIKICDTDFADIKEVDSKLIELATTLGGVVLTNDYNLNKVAAIKGVSVLNINELANALKPSVLPGEEMTVTIIKTGKDPNQGVAYLDDGTMIVVDHGKKYLNQKITVVVTSVFQTPAGRMIFTQPEDFE